MHSQVESGRKVAVTVSDTGIGIPRNKLATIFLPFEQVRARVCVLRFCWDARACVFAAGLLRRSEVRGWNRRDCCKPKCIPYLGCAICLPTTNNFNSRPEWAPRPVPVCAAGGHVHQPQVRRLWTGAQHRAGACVCACVCGYVRACVYVCACICVGGGGLGGQGLMPMTRRGRRQELRGQPR